MSSPLRNTLLELGASEQLEFDFDLPPQTPPHHEPLLTLRQAAAAFNVGVHALRRAIKAGSIPSYRIGNARVRLRSSDIARAIEASRTGGPK